MGKGHKDQQATTKTTDYLELNDKHHALPGNKVAPETDSNGSVLIETETDAKLANSKIALEKLRRRREQEPLLYCKLVTKYPVRSFALTLSAHLSVIVLSLILVSAGYDLFPFDFENLPLELNDIHWRPRDLSWRQREQYNNFYDRTPISGSRVNSYPRANIDLIYDGDGTNVFTKQSLEKIQEIENRLTSVSEYANNYCQVNVALTECEKTTSILRYFDGTFSNVSATLYDPTFSNIPGVLFEAYTNNETKEVFQYFLGKHHEITPTTSFTYITRSIIPIGYPLQEFINDVDGFEKRLQEFSADSMLPILEDVRENNGVFKFAYRSELLWNYYVFTQATKDAMCAVGSICFIFLLIMVHTKSLWIAGFAILSIIASFFTTNLIYRIALDFRYLGFFHILTLFIVLGIGADDIFVFYDVWRNTGYEEYPSLAHRLSDAYRKSVFSMLFTSITTAVAFFASTISPLLATRSFGVFSGLVVLVNYLSVILFFPTVVVMYHTKFEHFRWPCVSFVKKQCGRKCKCCLPNSELRTNSDITVLHENVQYGVSTSVERSGVNKLPPISVISVGPQFSSTNSVYPNAEKRLPPVFTSLHNTTSGDKAKVSVVKRGNSFKTQIAIDNPGDNIPEKEKETPIERFYSNGYENHDFLDDTIVEERDNVECLKKTENPKVYSNGYENHDFLNDTIVEERDNVECLKKTENPKVYSNGYVNHAFLNDTNVEGNDNVDCLEAGPSGVVKRYGVYKSRKQKSLMVRFFREKYFAFVTHKVWRVVILLVVAAVLSFFIYQATRLEPDNQGLRVIKDSHVYSVARDHTLYSFVASDFDRTITIHIIWGMMQNDMNDCHFSTPKCQGKKVWDDSFNPSTPEAQLAVKEMCDNLMNLSPEEAYKLRLKTDFRTGEYQIDCYIRSLNDFLDAETASTGVDWGLTYNYTKAIDFMDNRTTFYDSSGFTSDYEHYLQIPISDWLSNKQTYQYTNDFFVYDQLIGEETGTFTKTVKTQTSKKYGNNIKYVAIQVNTTLQVATLGYSDGIPIMNYWEDFINNQNVSPFQQYLTYIKATEQLIMVPGLQSKPMQAMPVGMKNGYQATFLIWHWLVVQEALVVNAVYGIIIGVSVAFPMFVIATRNIITGTLAMLTICCSTVCVIGVIPLGGWKLGVLESLNLCMVVGLTVDYVVHLAEGYTLSLRTDRKSRVQDMLDEMAISIFFGACTTLGASMFMFIAQLSFFLQFGIFMFSTIGFSLFFSMLLFVTLMGIIGPQNNVGNLEVLIRNIHQRCKRKKDNRQILTS